MVRAAQGAAALLKSGRLAGFGMLEDFRHARFAFAGSAAGDAKQIAGCAQEDQAQETRDL